MIEKFFIWLSTLSKLQGMGLLALLGLLLLAIPYGRFLLYCVKQLVYRKPLVIERFSYHFQLPDTAAPDFIVKGSALILSWKVSGAWKTDLEPVGKDLRGNAAILVFDPAQTVFVLKAYGLFGAPLMQRLEIPLQDAYRMELTPVSRSVKASEPLPVVHTAILTKSLVTAISFVRSKMRINRKTPGINSKTVHVARMDASGLVLRRWKRKGMYRFLDQKKILRSYTFSTSKFPYSRK